MTTSGGSETDAFQQALQLSQAGRLDDASAACEGILAVEPAHLGTKHLMGNIAMARGDHVLAAALFEEAINLAPHLAQLYANRGDALLALDRTAEALACYEAACERNSDHPKLHLLRGIALQRLDRPDDALVSISRAVTLNPDFAKALHARGVTLSVLGRFAEALADYDRLSALRPMTAKMHLNRGIALEGLERRSEARAEFDKALALSPDWDEARDQMFNLHLSDGIYTSEFEAFAADTAQRTADRDAHDLLAHRTIPDYRALHDLEQTAYMIARGCDAAGLHETHAALTAARARYGQEPVSAAISLTAAEAATCAAFRSKMARHPVSVLPGGALNPNKDWAAVEDEYFRVSPETVVIDDLLSPEALTSLREFSLLSTVWRRDYPSQYLGAFSQSGFVGPLHFQIAAEFQQKMPRIFAPHRLRQLWAFKYTSSTAGTGIGIHADDARVNMNFWITPDEANLDPASGGMIVYDVPPPPSWRFHAYNTGESRDQIYAFLKQNGATARTVPYRANRAVLFNSKLFHETDTIRFKGGYENRRINVTYLFGRAVRV